MRSLLRAIGALSLVLAVLAMLSTAPALAHERREVGKYTFVVGFLNEPAYQDGLNGVDLRITNTETKEPLTGAEKTLNVTVQAGGKELPLKFRAVFNQPGHYAADFIPTRAGAYAFRVTGTLDGQPVDQRFESGPGRFNDIESTSAVQFPDAVPAGNAIAQQVAAAQAAAQQAQTLGLAGAGLGLIGLLAGLAACLLRPKPAAMVVRPLTPVASDAAHD